MGRSRNQETDWNSERETLIHQVLEEARCIGFETLNEHVGDGTVALAASIYFSPLLASF